jgi:DNA repair protein RecO (recombination protein O)
LRKTIRTAFCSSAAIVLRTRVYGESDKLVTVLSRDYGKLTALAKGALRSRRRFVNALEPFSHIRLGFRMRAGADLGWIDSAEVVRLARNVSRDLERYAWSAYVVDVTDSMVEGREAEPPLFDLVEETLQRIDSSWPEPLRVQWLRYFETRFLTLAGFEPRIDRCSRCSRPAPGSIRRLRFQPRLGNIVCDECSDGSGIVVSAEAIEAILRFREGEVEPPLKPWCASQVRAVLQAAMAHRLRRPLRSPPLLRALIGSDAFQ